MLALATGLVACLMVSGSASAAVVTWAGNGGNWNNTSSWSGGALPVNGDSVLFTNSGSSSSSTVGIMRSLTEITFGASANRTYTLSNSGTFVTSLGSITNSSGFVQNVNNQLNLSTSGTIDTGAFGISIGGKLTGNGSFNKVGSGRLDITNGNNSGFAGTLTVDAGELKLSTGVDAANVIVNTGARLLTANNPDNGYANSITVNSGANLTPGDGGYGGFNVTNGVTLNAGSTSTFGVGGLGSDSFDAVTSGGLTTFGGGLTISMDYVPSNFGTAPNFMNGDSWALFTSGSFTGDFTSVTLTGTPYGTVEFFKADADRWQTSYLGNGQEFSFFTSGANAGVLFAVPEPSSIVFAGIGIAMFGWSTWSRRRAKTRRQAIESVIA